MTSEDYRYITTLILGVAGVQITIQGLLVGLLWNHINSKVTDLKESIATRLKLHEAEHHQQ